MTLSKPSKRILKIIGYLIIDILIIVLLVFALFYLFEDEIKNKVLSIVNKNQNGEIAIKEIDLNLFKYFPLISLQLEDVTFYEQKWAIEEGNSSIIAQTNLMDVSLNVVDLIYGDIIVEKLSIEQGEFNFNIYPDSTTNLLRAIGEKSAEEDSSKSDIILRNVSINNFNLKIKNDIGESDAHLRIYQLSNNFSIREDVIDCQLNFAGLITKLSSRDDIDLKNREISADLDFVINIDSLYGDLNSGRIEFEELILLAKGKFGYPDDYLAKLELDLSDDNVELLSQVFSDELLGEQKDMITQGSMYGKGKILWKSLDLLPIIDFNFGLLDLNLVFSQDTSISVYLDFDGHLYTGENPDLSELKIDITDMKIQLPEGMASGSFSLHNWQNPTFDLQIDADLDITGYENIFKIEIIDSLKGRIKLKTNLNGYYDRPTRNLIYRNEEAELNLNNISFRVPKFGQKQYQINGYLTQSDFTINLHDLAVLSSSGDLVFRGKISSLYSYLIEGGENISGELQIKSRQLELSKVPVIDESILKVIGKEMSDLSTDLAFKIQKSSNSQSQHSKIVLRECSFKLKDYPDVHRFSGEFDFEKNVLGIKNLHLNTDSGNLILNGDLDLNKNSSIGINSSIYLTEFYINKFASKNPHADVIELDYSGKLSGELSINTENGYDFLNLSDIYIDHSNFYYLNKTDEDTVTLQGINGILDQGAINVSDGDKILSTLTISGKIELRQLIINEFKHRTLTTRIEGQSGKIRLSKNQIELFGILGEIIIDADFSDEEHRYRIEQKATGHDINHIFDSVTENDLVDGMLDISIWLEMQGTTRDNILKTLRGQILNRGKDLRIRRVDIDAIVKNFKDTQNFKLLDVGAFVFAGPAGAVVTKSVDYANLLRMNPGDSTMIGNFISDIEISEGQAHINDMAFNTQNNRIAFGGDIDLANLSFVNFVIAIVDRDGCITLSQQLNGPFNEPTLEEFSTIGTILAPITNAYNSLIGKECTPYYTGEVIHPN